MTYSTSSIVTPRPTVASQRLDDEVVLLDGAGERYYTLSPVGARAWELFTAGANFGDTVQALLDEFDATEDTVTTDLTELVDDLLARKLVSVR